MNDDYENEEVNEEQEYESSDNYATPPSSNNPFYNVRNKIREKTSNLKKNAFSAFFNALKGAITFIVSNPIILAILLFFIGVAMIWLIVSEQTAKKVSSSVDKYISSAEDMDPTAKGLYESRHSLILLKLSEINEMYDKFIKDKGVSGDIRTAMKTKVGKNDVENKKAGVYDSESFTLEGYDKQFKPGSDGVRDDERVKIITGSTAPISTYKVGGKYTYSNGQIGGCPVEIVDITIPVWKSNGASKVASTVNLQVNSKIKGMVQSIFQEIYDDPSQPVINEIGCFRSGDGYPNHPFGTGIDINPNSNPQIKTGAYVGGKYNPGGDPLSMDANHPIVKIFTQKYGWDWGGNWNSYKDYMHFSFMGG